MRQRAGAVPRGSRRAGSLCPRRFLRTYKKAPPWWRGHLGSRRSRARGGQFHREGRLLGRSGRHRPEGAQGHASLRKLSLDGQRQSHAILVREGDTDLYPGRFRSVAVDRVNGICRAALLCSQSFFVLVLAAGSRPMDAQDRQHRLASWTTRSRSAAENGAGGPLTTRRCLSRVTHRLDAPGGRPRTKENLTENAGTRRHACKAYRTTTVGTAWSERGPGPLGGAGWRADPATYERESLSAVPQEKCSGMRQDQNNALPPRHGGLLVCARLAGVLP